jgi:hypothetical protein
MIKLNGNVYLTEMEIDRIVGDTSTQFRTSQRAILPKQVTYLDREFVEAVHTEAKNTTLSVFYLYGYGEDYASVKNITQAVTERFRKIEECCSKLYFMQYDLSDSQRKQYRNQYENFLINIFLEECILNFKKLS